MGGTLTLWTFLLGVIINISGGLPYKGSTNQSPAEESEEMIPTYVGAAGQDGTSNVAWPWVPYSSPIALEQSAPPPPPPAPVFVRFINSQPQLAETKGPIPQTGSEVYVEVAPVIDPPAPVVPVLAVDPPEPETAVIVPGPPPPPVLPPQPVYKPGKVIHKLSVYEHGSDESEFHDTGDLPPSPQGKPEDSVSEESGFNSLSVPEESSFVSPPEQEHDDKFFQMFLTGQLIPGTITHISSTYEHGHSAWTDIGFERVPLQPKPATKTPLPPKPATKVPLPPKPARKAPVPSKQATKVPVPSKQAKKGR